MKKRIRISIVSHGQGQLVDQLLQDIDTQVLVKDHDLEVVITDNLNVPNWNPKLQNFKLTKICNLRIKGFGANHNAAFERSTTDYYFVVNPDVRLLNTVNLDEIVNKMADLTIYSPKIYNSFENIEDFVRGEVTFLNLVKRKFGLPEIQGRFWFAGIFHGYTSETFCQLKGFDTKYFMYVEDADLCYRLHNMGGTLEIYDDFNIVHDAQRQSLIRVRHFIWHVQSLARFFCKKIGLINNG